MRVVGGAFLVAVAMLFFYLITTGKLASAIATFHVLSGGSTGMSSSPATAGAPTVTPTPTPAVAGSNPYGANSWSTPMTFPGLPTVPSQAAVPIQAA